MNRSAYHVQYHLDMIITGMNYLFLQKDEILEPDIKNLLVRRECCSFDHGEYLKKGLSELESWCHQATEKVNKQKTNIALDYISHDLCPALNIKQLYKISSMYRDGIYNTPTVSPDHNQVLRGLGAATKKHSKG
ncbi:IQ motif, EF-hand binding site [Artemisia annua]|uniref:IQ motif, EF-hand binding site n=1 Tax=Artemisia annua TaxID=35608 RepID=A0A2U1QJ20_ARTAN|nr:IQ motif, EF-hand binding site [Artemisia annua]